ncbi:MAG: hypothetical protein CM15mP79_0100 [Methanobacteriota archaeon]|nr:MAG: hypothetical protein CM15mP79_0100 [Euryarchaeota archaeon]
MGLFNRFRRRVKETVDASDAEGMLADEGSDEANAALQAREAVRNNLQRLNRSPPATTIGTTQRTTLSLRLRRTGTSLKTTGNCPRKRRHPPLHPWLNPVGKHRWRRRSSFA